MFTNIIISLETLLVRQYWDNKKLSFNIINNNVKLKLLSY